VRANENEDVGVDDFFFFEIVDWFNRGKERVQVQA
jgi:hypothetical protein